MRALLAALLLSTAGCGDSDGNVQAKVGWRFDYADYKDDTAAADLRDCSNAPAVAREPPYSPIAKVRVALEDPEGQVPGSDEEHNCPLGIDGKLVPIAGLVRQLFTFTIEAKTAAGAVLYRYTQPEFDLGSYSEETYTLPTATGEIHFFPTFAGNLTCPPDVSSIAYTLYAEGASTPTMTGVQSPACESSGTGPQSRELVIREIPVVLTSSRATYNLYRLVLEARNSGGAVLHCAVNGGRVVRLGDNALGGNESLQPGPCPP